MVGVQYGRPLGMVIDGAYRSLAKRPRPPRPYDAVVHEFVERCGVDVKEFKVAVTVQEEVEPVPYGFGGGFKLISVLIEIPEE